MRGVVIFAVYSSSTVHAGVYPTPGENVGGMKKTPPGVIHSVDVIIQSTPVVQGVLVLGFCCKVSPG